MNRRQFRQLPHFAEVELNVGLSWHGGGDYRYEEKVDGLYCEADASGLFFKGSSKPLPAPLPDSLSDCRIVGELKAGTLHVFDLIHKGNRQVWKLPLIERLPFIQSLELADWMKPIRSGHGGEFLEMILAEGGEGIVAKNIGGFFGKMHSWVKCKRNETHDCLVTEINSDKVSAHLTMAGIDRGWCKVNESVSVGDVIEVRCHSIHKSGKFREPVFVRSREDKCLPTP